MRSICNYFPLSEADYGRSSRYNKTWAKLRFGKEVFFKNKKDSLKNF